jgi:hypothetical protein
LISAPPVEVAPANQQTTLFSLQDGAEKEFRLALDDIMKLIDAGEKGHLTYNDVGSLIPHDVHSSEDLDDLMYRKNKNPFHKENRTIEHILGLMGVV